MKMSHVIIILLRENQNY